MNQVYSRQQLEAKSLAELKAIALSLGAQAADRRIKASWVDAIIDAQPTKVDVNPELEVIDETVVDVSGKVVAAIACDEDPTQPWFVLVGSTEVHRANTWAKCFEYVRRNHKNGTLPQVKEQEEQVDDYLFHSDRPSKLEVVESVSGFVVINHGNSKQYSVNHQVTHCTCPDHRYRNRYCKHQKEVNKLFPRLSQKIKSCPICLGSGALGDEEYLERCYYCDGTGKAQFAA